MPELIKKDFDYDKVYYLSGPMAGYAEHNFPAFDAAKLQLTLYGIKIVSPHQIKPSIESPTDADYLTADIHEMVCKCTGIILLAGWPHSVGAWLELAIARGLNWPVYYFDSHLGTLTDMNGEKDVR